MRLSLAKTIWLSAVGALLLGVVSSTAVLLWAIRAQKAVETILSENLGQAAAIADLKIALLELNGLVALRILDDPATATATGDIERQEARLADEFARVDRIPWEPDQRALIGPLRNAFEAYEVRRRAVSALVGCGDISGARRELQHELNATHARLFELCERLNKANNRDIEMAIRSRQEQTQRVGVWVGISLVLAAVLVSGLLWFSFNAVFRPLRRMADEARRHVPEADRAGRRDELHTLGRYLDDLKADVVEARSSLAQSRSHLMDAEKLAVVGRLAAGVAHEIRSPLTALKLRLFSMQKASGAAGPSLGDFQVMSEEIARLDNIVRNFLEFSRPPEIHRRQHDISLLLDKTVEILRYRTDAGHIRIERTQPQDLPPALVDGQQMRQVFINLMNNAIDAQPNGGVLRIGIAVASRAGRPGLIRVRLGDNGPGVPAAIRERIFDPFATTKTDGAGLGLWIARRIMTEHGGDLELEESTERGTTFAVWIPAHQEDPSEQGAGS